MAKNAERPFVPFFTREETAYKIAWSKVKKVYEKNSKGNWAKRD
ncbi:ChaB family protein [Methanosarcina sp. UBA289]|nr:ChaB family protein [Methanosarcina sp. UBA289]